MTVAELVQGYGRKVRRKNDGWLMCCLYPEHRDSTPSFSVNDSGLFFCWGCQRKGNFSRLLHDIAGWSWKKSIEHADIVTKCSRLPENFNYVHDRDAESDDGPISEGLLGLFDVDWEQGYERWRQARDDGDNSFPPWTFPFQKGFTPATLRHFDAGYDTDFQRVTIPVRDSANKLRGFLGRTCIGSDQKYMVYPPLKPSQHIYNGYLTQQPEHIVIFEGAWDTWMFHQCGLDGAEYHPVAVMTTHVTYEQALALTRLQPRVSFILLFDNDYGGKRGATKVAKVLMQTGLKIDIAMTAAEQDMKRLSKTELTSVLQRRKPYPAPSALALLEH